MSTSVILAGLYAAMMPASTDMYTVCNQLILLSLMMRCDAYYYFIIYVSRVRHQEGRQFVPFFGLSSLVKVGDVLVSYGRCLIAFSSDIHFLLCW